MIRGLIEIVLDIFFPRRCAICDHIVRTKGKKACSSCVESLQVIQEPRCKKCGKPIENDEVEYCYDCTTKHFHYERGYGLWIYDDQMKKSIAAFKYKNRREYAQFYVEEVLGYYTNTIESISPEAFIPIPLHKSRLRTRGYNQSELIAKGIGKVLEIPVMVNVLYRTKKTLPQKKLNDRERFRNLSSAFTIDEKFKQVKSKPTRVMLIDDIYTTGSTIEACTKVLLEAGIQEVFFLSLCIGKGY